jgi:HEAT repeat protein
MKTGRNKIVKVVAVVIAAMILSSNAFAMNLKGDKTEVPEKMVQNLAVGIASDNLGLKTNCIYFAGFYEIEELVQPLVKQLAKESNPNTRVLIALALYKIGNVEAINAVEKLAKNDTDPSVKKIGNAILAGFQNKAYSNNFNISNK